MASDTPDPSSDAAESPGEPPGAPGVSDVTPEPALERLFHHGDRVRLVDWRSFTDARTAVIAVGAVAVLAFVTGLSHLSRPDTTYDGPLAGLIPTAPDVVPFLAVLSAFVLGGVAFGLNRRKRLAWYLAVVVVPGITAFPLTTGRTTEIPLLVAACLAVPLLVANRDSFDQRLELSSLQIASLSSVVGVLLYGSVGSYALREQFGALETWSDSFYYVIVTIATVGYGDITPLTTEAKWFSLSVIVFGTGAFTVAIGALIVPAIEKRMAAAFGNMTPSELSLLEDHVLVLGYGDVTEPLLEELAAETDVVVVTPDSDRASALSDREVNVLTADPTLESTLVDAGIETATGVVVATRNDANDVLAVLAAREAAPDVRIVAAANEREHADKLAAVGADEVISPMAIGGRLLGRSVLDETSADALFDDGTDGETTDDTGVDGDASG